jgi:Reverse transcriptase (RNA-dependent DNA polymerase)
MPLFRVLHTTRTRNAPIALLDLQGTYPSVPRQELINLVRERVAPHLANMLTVLLAPTRVLVIGDPLGTIAITQRSLTQGDLKATTLFSLFLDPLLEELDPNASMFNVKTFSDGVSSSPELLPSHLQQQLDLCGRWAWFTRMTWSVKKCYVVVPPMQQVQAH